ncbi:MBL fold metallo-hydrolase [Clostridium cylindrosporum]|uniref:Metal dependent hydrolase n=1 Tax=Clostridium cylindrosporum DSM 605 TaxID=1121307 RepID=A0A0J8D870_CLOCY|nr:MBL fold metallo-hydrolase [Clostridium cylindrosporum]KMT22255.1 metal dependent hydrolase [Clostridium cylindrosporum DSM 605]
MKLTVVVDNNTYIDRYFSGEPGLSFYIEEEGQSILFDVGYSDIFLKNSMKMNIDLKKIDYIAISHGHIDHTWGLSHLINHYSEYTIEGTSYTKPEMIAHPNSFLDKRHNNQNIGSLISKDTLIKHFNLKLSADPIWVTSKLIYLGEIERSNNVENKTPIGKVKMKSGEVDDYLLDDSALVYKSSKGLVIITGCAHSGICNIIEYAKKVCKDNRVADVIGGFHLLSPKKDVIDYTCKYIKDNNIKVMHPCHCTDLKSKIELSNVCDVKEVGVGLVLEYN